MNKKIVLNCACLALGLSILSQGTADAKTDRRRAKSFGLGSLKDAPQIEMSTDTLRSFITSAAHSPSMINKVIERSKTDVRVFHAFLQRCEGDIGYREHIMYYISKTDNQELVDLILMNKDKYPKALKMLHDFKRTSLAKTV